jgi:excisionase family DNA binding protein
MRASRPRQTTVTDAPREPLLMTSDEVATLLRTSRNAIYAMVARNQLPGVTKLGRRILFRTSVLLDWLDQNRAPSPRSE